MLKQLSVFILLVSSMLLTACYDEVGVTIHEAGEYKGPVDPLVNASRSTAHKERLRKRFDMVQTDR
ncbi:MAG: hypothetical protein KAT06_13080 [Gammaproteobacteria bacterium]|nr:hypothetical protein [Gammaproteobacteria bacterium]